MARVVEMIDQAGGAKTSRQSLSLLYSPRRRPQAALERMLAFVDADTPNVGPGNPVQLLEHRVAELLGKPAALLLPTGKMAQQVALRIHCERSGRPTFAAHPTCHVLNWEYDGYAVVHGLRCSRLGDAHRLFGTADIASIPEPPGAVVWELPQRELGGELPSWTDLQNQIELARGLGAAIHLDGARLWETQPAYDRPLGQIAALFDTVYVSLYKTLEVPRGAVLVGDSDFIAEARTWSVRLGGESVGNWPLGVAGLLAIDEILPRMSAYRDRAVEIAKLIRRSGAIVVRPDPPQTALFHVHIPVAPDVANKLQQEIAADSGIQLFAAARPTQDPARSVIEISVGEAAMDIDATQIADLITELVDRAAQQCAGTAGWKGAAG
jgi:threonine aldolase